MPLLLNFVFVNKAAATVCATLFLALLFVPFLVWQLFGIAGSAEIDFLARRAAMLFLGLAIITWQMAGIEDLKARRAISFALSVTMAGLALSGLAEYVRGFAGPGILAAAVAETVFSLLYACYWRNPGAV